MTVNIHKTNRKVRRAIGDGDLTGKISEQLLDVMGTSIKKTGRSYELLKMAAVTNNS